MHVAHLILTMQRSFNDWWNTVPSDLQIKARKGDEANKPLLNQVNYALLHLHLAGKHDAKPSHEELKDWLHSSQVDVIRIINRDKTTSYHTFLLFLYFKYRI